MAHGTQQSNWERDCQRACQGIRHVKSWVFQLGGQGCGSSKSKSGDEVDRLKEHVDRMEASGRVTGW